MKTWYDISCIVSKYGRKDEKLVKFSLFKRVARNDERGKEKEGREEAEKKGENVREKKVQKRKGKKSKELQFSINLMIHQDGGVSIARHSRAEFNVETSMWNRSTFKAVAVSLTKMFAEQALRKQACDTEHTDVWYMQKMTESTVRFTLYECGSVFLKANISAYA
jgi:hypothetical protein